MLDLYRGKLSYRKLSVLVDHLPPESATITAMRGSLTEDELAERAGGADPSKGAWSPDQMLLASIIDELRSFQHLYVSAHVKQGQAGKPPEPMPRPGVAKDKRRVRKSRLTDAQRRALDPRLRVVDSEPKAGGG